MPQVKRRLDWETGPAASTANIVSSSNGTRVISIRSVSAAPFGQKLPSGQTTTTTVISIPPSLRSSDQLPLAGSGTAGSAGSNNSNKLLRCSSDRTRTQVIQSSTVSITPVNVRDDHLFKTPIKPAPASAVLTPSARKRKVSGSSSSSSTSPRSSPASHSDSRSFPAAHHSGRARQSSSFSAFSDSPSGKSKHRYETSLGQLTKKFISLLRDAPSGVRKAAIRLPHLCFNCSLFPDAESE